MQINRCPLNYFLLRVFCQNNKSESKPWNKLKEGVAGTREILTLHLKRCKGDSAYSDQKGDGGLGHTALPTQLSPEPPSGVSNHTAEEGKQRTGSGPREPIRFRRNTSMVAPWTRAHSTRVTPSHVRSGAQKLAVGFVCRARAPTVCKESQRAPARPSTAPPCARLLQFLRRCRELGATASDCGGVKPRWQPRVSVAGPGKAGSAARPTRKHPRINEK